MKRNHIKIPYKHRIALVILLFTLFPCIFIETIYLKNIQQDWTRAAVADYQNDVDSSALLISKSITELQSKMEHVLNSSSIRSSIAQINKLSLVQALDFISILNEIAGSITADSKVLTVRWYPYLSTISYGDYCYTLDMFAEEFPLGINDPDYQVILALNEGESFWQVRNISREINNTGTPQMRLCLYTQMTNLNGSDCVLEFSIPVTEMLEPRISDSVPGSLFVACLKQNDESLNILLDSAFTANETEALITRYQQTGILSEYDILRASIPNVVNSEVIFLLPDSYSRNLIRPQIIKFIIISTLLLFIIVIASYLTSHLLTKRIIHTVNAINSDLNHILSEPLDSSYVEDDIGQISIHIRKLIQDTQEYCARLELYEAENLRMELELLQMRFNPHFLYNTLGAIRHQVRNSDARNSIDSLSHYYRIVLNNGHLILRIEDEIEMIKEYLSIEKFAYRLDNIEFEFQMDNTILQYTIIKHLLQPIVENALNHGLRPAGRDYSGRLLISGVLADDCIYICVTDNGVGMSPENAAKLLSAPVASTSGNGYGVYNVQQRIQVYYGKKYGLQINSTIGVGTSVTLKIPAMPSIPQ